MPQESSALVFTLQSCESFSAAERALVHYTERETELKTKINPKNRLVMLTNSLLVPNWKLTKRETKKRKSNFLWQ